MKIKNQFLVALSLFSVAVAGCQTDDQNNMSSSAGDVIGTDVVEGTQQPTPDENDIPNPTPTATADPSTTVGQSCHSNDSNKICLSLKYVSYVDANNAAVIDEADAAQNVVAMNSLWAQCNIAFEIGEYIAVDPADYGYALNTSSKSDLPGIRNKFQDSSTLLIVNTGTWSGSLGALSTNAWTMMPGTSSNGTVVEANSAHSPKLIAHELGHYLNLDHFSDSSNMMNPVIYSGSTTLSSNQCNTARAAAKYYWSAMYR